MNPNNFVNNIRISECDALKFGGRTRADRLAALAEESERQLPLCPFCGGKAGFTYTMLYQKPALGLECEECHAKTPSQPEGVSVLTGEYITFETVIERLAQRWAQRVNAPLAIPDETSGRECAAAPVFGIKEKRISLWGRLIAWQRNCSACTVWGNPNGNP